MANKSKIKALHGKKSDQAYLLDLANRLMNVPVMYGVNGFDIDCLSEMAKRLEARDGDV